MLDLATAAWPPRYRVRLAVDALVVKGPAHAAALPVADVDLSDRRIEVLLKPWPGHLDGGKEPPPLLGRLACGLLQELHGPFIGQGDHGRVDGVVAVVAAVLAGHRGRNRAVAMLTAWQQSVKHPLAAQEVRQAAGDGKDAARAAAVYAVGPAVKRLEKLAGADADHAGLLQVLAGEALGDVLGHEAFELDAGRVALELPHAGEHVIPLGGVVVRLVRRAALLDVPVLVGLAERLVQERVVKALAHRPDVLDIDAWVATDHIGDAEGLARVRADPRALLRQQHTLDIVA